METSANFAFLTQEFPRVAESASYAERHVYADPRAACFHARHALERLVKRVYKIDATLSPPKVQNLDYYIQEPAFRDLVPDVVWQKAEYVRKAGNVAVHGNKTPNAETAVSIVRELSHVAYWAGRTYLRQGAKDLQGKTYDESLIPKDDPTRTAATLTELAALKTKLDEAENIRQELEEELTALRDRLAVIKAENEAVPETHDWSEAETRRLIIDLDLARAGWPLDQPTNREYEVTGMPNAKGVGYADYVLWGDDGKPLAVIEAKKTTVDPAKGQQQAKLYADCLEAMHRQRPIVFYTNGYTTHLWDDASYPPRKVEGFYTKAELSSLINRRAHRTPLDVTKIKNAIVDRYYQKRAITSIGEQFTQKRRKALLVMATGSGKTRLAVALVDQLQRAGWIKRTLFLADRVALVNQAVGAFKEHLPESSPVNLVSEPDKTGRVYVSTYPTMMGLINDSRGQEARYGVGYFDLVIIDEAHRSVYQKYGEIFQYFDSLLVGLTATPSDHVDKNTYKLCDLEPGMPTDAYELETAVTDGFLVPPRVEQVELKFPREGIDYDALPDEEKEEWESLEWGEQEEGKLFPTRVNASAINKWLFNTDTVDKALQYVMEHGHKVAGGDRLAKTILFARNHDHAVFIEQRFNHHYPNHKGHFARIIDHYATYAQSILDDFSQKDKAPHLAISVDMLDTGIDVPEVANLVFFKPVYSKIKFWQMIGRGTRLCVDLFGPDENKQDFRVFDFCFNFEFFREHPQGLEGRGSVSLGMRLFQSRVQLLTAMQATPDLDPQAELARTLTTTLHEEVKAMNCENFIVRMEREAVERFQQQKHWEPLTQTDAEVLHKRIAGLPSEIDTDEIESRLFDFTILRMQVALVEGNQSVGEKSRLRVIELAGLLEEKNAIPAVMAQLAYLASIQESTFWEGINLHTLEEVRLRLRGLMPLLDKKTRKIVYTDFKDEILGVSDPPIDLIPKMTGVQYEKKVKDYLTNHLDHIVIQRLRTNKSLTKTDLQGLEQTLVEIGENDTKLLTSLLARQDAPSLAYFVRGMVGMDRTAAHAAFSEFLSDRSLTEQQIRFIEMVIEQLTARGVMKTSALYEQPFTSLHVGGPDEIFSNKPGVIEGIFQTLGRIESDLRTAVA